MIKRALVLATFIIFIFPAVGMSQEQTGESGTVNPTNASGAPAGNQAAMIASQSGGFGVVTTVVVGAAVIGGLVAVVLESATDGSKISTSTSTTTTTTTTTSTSSSN